MTDTHIKINAVTPRVQYTGNGVTTVFPYSFAIFDETDMVVYVDDDIITTGYTVSGAGQTDGGEVTFDSAPASGKKITLLRDVPIERLTDFQEGGAFRPKNLNDEFDRQTAFVQQVQEKVDRTLILPPTTDIDPSQVLAEVERIYRSIDKVDAVADDISNVNSVAGDLTKIDSVADDLTNIDGVADNLTAINAVNSNKTNINAVNSNKTNINAVAGNATNINAVAGNATNINAVAGNATNINAVNSNKTNINAVASNASNINTVAGISGNVTTVAGISSDVSSLVGSLTNINSVASDLTNIDAVASELPSIITKANTDASNITATGKQTIVGWGMPNGSAIDLTFLSSGVHYTAPANGFYDIGLNLNGWANVSTSAGVLLPFKGNGVYASCLIQVKKNDEMWIDYSGATKSTLLFIYAGG